MSIKAYKYRIYPNKTTREKLQWTLDRARELYNAALQEHKEAWTYAKKSVTYNQQAAQLSEIKEVREEYRDIYSQVLQDTLQRVDKAFKAFFRRVKNGETPGYPRYQSANRYDSFTFPQKGFSLTHDNRLCLSKIGTIKVKMHREIQGKVKTCTIKREGEHWYVCFACEVEACPRLSYTDEVVGVDLGVMRLATLSTGTTVEHPRYYRHAEKKLNKAQQSLSRKKRGSKRRKKAVKRVAKLHKKVRRQRQNFLHAESKWLIDTYEVIVFEDLKTAHLTKRPKPKQDEHGKYLPNGAAAKGGLNKSIFDAGWGQFVQYCVYKAESAGTLVAFVDPRNTSQLCSACGKKGPHKDLSERTHTCIYCGIVLDRDENAAINIRQRWITSRLGRSHQEAQVS
jgi:putative transposase